LKKVPSIEVVLWERGMRTERRNRYVVKVVQMFVFKIFTCIVAMIAKVLPFR